MPRRYRPRAMATAVKTTVTELPESRVRLDAEVPPQEVQKSVERAARTLGRDLRMPGFRKGKVPPPVVIQRFGRETVLDEAVRGALGRWYLDAIDAAGIHPVGDPDVELGDLPPQGQPLTFTVEIGVRPTARWASTRASRWRAASPPPTRRPCRPSSTSCASAPRAWRPSTSAAGQGDFVVMDYVGSVDGEDVRRRRGARPAHRARLGAPRPRLRGAAHRREGRRRAHGRRSPSPTTTAPRSSRARRRSSPSRSRRSSARSCPSSTTTSPPTRPASTRSTSCARTSRPSCARPTSARRGASSARPCSTPSSTNATVDVPEALVDARARELWDRMLHSLSHQGITKELYLQIAGKTRGGDPRGGQARRRAGAAARGGDRRGHRGRGHRARRGRHPRRAAGRRPRASARRRRSCASSLEKAGRLDDAARGPRAARRRRPPGRARDADLASSGPRRATSSGRRATPRRARRTPPAAARGRRGAPGSSAAWTSGQSGSSRSRDAAPGRAEGGC